MKTLEQSLIESLEEFLYGTKWIPNRVSLQGSKRVSHERLEPTYPIIMKDGTPYYHCVMCHAFTKVADVPFNEQKLKNGHFKRTSIRGSATIGFKLLSETYKGSEVTRSYAPIRISGSEKGWICLDH